MVNVKPVKLGNRERMSFGKINEVIDMPNLIDVQKQSYQWFLDEGLKEVFKDVSGITDYQNNLVLDFIDYSIDVDHPNYSIVECKSRDATFSAALRVTARLLNRATGEIKESNVFMGDFPLMTPSGTFIINGAERVIVSQLVRSPGVYYKMDHDKTGQGEAIARNLMEMSGLTVPVIAVVTGEGSSGGALALGVANHILMLENAVYSVLSPEGFASILWKDASRSGEACEMMKLTAQDLYRDGIVEEVIPEPLGGAQRGHAALFEHLDTALRNHLRELCRMNGRQLADQRYKKYRQIGETRNA